MNHPPGSQITSFVSTGSLPSLPNIICSDSAGLAVTAEKISHTRYMSHFRTIHRGSFFATMRTTAVRQMLPEAWGERVGLLRGFCGVIKMGFACGMKSDGNFWELILGL